MDTRNQPQRSEVDALRAELERLEADHRRFREEVDRELVRRTYRIGELERSLHQRSMDYETSLSWRITRPLRGLKKLLAELRRR